MKLHAEDKDCEGQCRSCTTVGSCSSRIVCRCLKVTEHQLIDSIRTHGITTLVELRVLTGAGTGCNCCHRELQSYLDIYSPSSSVICSAR